MTYQRPRGTTATVQGPHAAVPARPHREQGEQPKMTSHDDEGRPYSLRLLPLDGLCVDESYQRPVTAAKMAYLRNNWDLLAAGMLRVNARPDGSLYVMDGQHRLLAAREIGLAQMDCAVYRVPVEMEARLFERWNTHATTATPQDVFKARLRYGEPVATAIHDIVVECGYVVITNRSYNLINGIGAVRTLEQIYRCWDTAGRVPDPERLRRVLRFIRRVWPEQEGATGEMMLRTVDRLLQRYRRDLDEKNFTEKLSVHSPLTLAYRAGEQAKLLREDAATALLREMVRIYNKGKTPARRLAEPKI